MVLLMIVLIIHVCRRPEIKVALLQTRGSYLSIYWQHLIKALPGVDNDQHCWTWKVLKCSILPLDLFSITGGKQMCKIGGLGLSVCFHTINETLGGTRLLFCSGTSHNNTHWPDYLTGKLNYIQLWPPRRVSKHIPTLIEIQIYDVSEYHGRKHQVRKRILPHLLFIDTALHDFFFNHTSILLFL